MGALGILTAIFGERGVVGSVVDILKGAGVLADPEMELKALQALQAYETRLKELDTQQILAQVGVNLEDAKSEDAFQRRWRPFVGWVCGVAFAWHFVFQPVTLFVFAATGYTVPAPLPEFDMGTLMTVLGGLLGLGVYRTFEKFKGVN